MKVPIARTQLTKKSSTYCEKKFKCNLDLYI